MNELYQFAYAEDGKWSNSQSTFQYVVGRNDTVMFELTRTLDFDVTCEVTVNGQVCDRCFKSDCADRFAGWHVYCENVDDVGYVDLCDARRDDDDGPLAVIAFQDPVYLQGCPPRIEWLI